MKKYRARMKNENEDLVWLRIRVSIFGCEAKRYFAKDAEPPQNVTAAKINANPRKEEADAGVVLVFGSAELIS